MVWEDSLQEDSAVCDDGFVFYSLMHSHRHRESFNYSLTKAIG